MADIETQGYSKEEEYFYKLNKDLIERKRKELDRNAVTGAGKTHWMMCPKCDGAMKEIALAGIKVDQCSTCKGIYFDHGELDILLESKEPKGFLGGLKKLFS